MNKKICFFSMIILFLINTSYSLILEVESKDKKEKIKIYDDAVLYMEVEQNSYRNIFGEGVVIDKLLIKSGFYVGLKNILEFKPLKSRIKGWFRAEIKLKDNSVEKIRFKHEEWESAFHTSEILSDYNNLKYIKIIPEENELEYSLSDFVKAYKKVKVYTDDSLIEYFKNNFMCIIEVNDKKIEIEKYDFKDNTSKENFKSLDYIEKVEYLRKVKEEKQKLAEKLINLEKEEQKNREKEKKIIDEERKINKCQFDKVNWDMTKEQIRKLEGSKERIDDNSIFYYGHEKGYDCEYGYIFSKEDGKLWRKYYMFEIPITATEDLGYKLYPAIIFANTFLPETYKYDYGHNDKTTDAYMLMAQIQKLSGNGYSWKKGDTEITLKISLEKSNEKSIILMLFYDKNTK